jgi:hypothetical protein
MNLRQLVPLTVAGVMAIALFACCDPPLPPETPWGPARGMKGLALACSTRTIDPTGGQVAYQQSEWSVLLADNATWGDTHAYQIAGLYQVKAQTKTAKSGGSKWSDPFSIRIDVGEGEVRRRFGFTDPEDPEDSSDFSLNTFAIGADGRSYIGCEWAMVFRDEEGRRDKEFYTEDLDDFVGAPTLTNSGVLYACCANETLYALNTDGTRKWTWETGDEVYATPALGTDGTIFIHTSTDSLYAVNPDGTRKWAHLSSGNSSPVIGPEAATLRPSSARTATSTPAARKAKYTSSTRQPVSRKDCTSSADRRLKPRPRLTSGATRSISAMKKDCSSPST